MKIYICVHIEEIYVVINYSEAFLTQVWSNHV